MTKRHLIAFSALLLSASALFAADDYTTWFQYKTKETDIFGKAFYDPADSTQTAVAAVAGQKYYIPPKMNFALIGSTSTFKGDVLAVDSGSRLKCGSGGRVATFPELRLLPGGGFDYGSNWHVAGKVVVCGTTANPSVATPFLFGDRVYEFRANFLGEAGTVFRIAEQKGASNAKGGVINRTSILASHPDISGNWEKFYGTIQVATNTYLTRSGAAQNISGKVQVQTGGYFGSSLTSGAIKLGGLELQPVTEMLFQFGSALAHPIYTITNSFAASGNFRIACTGTNLAFSDYDADDLVLIRYTGTDANFSCDLTEAQVAFETTKTHPQRAHLEWRNNATLGCKELVVVPELPLVIGGLKAMTGWQEAFRLNKSFGTITEDDILFSGYESVRGQCRYRVRIEEDGDEQVVFVEDLMPGTYNASSGYVTMATGHADESSHATYLKERAMSSNTLYWTELNGLKAAWSDGQNPHATTNYYPNTWLGSVNEIFAGRSLTVAGNCKIRIYPEGRSPTISDYRLLPSAILPYDINGTDDYTLGGTATLLSTHAKPNTLQGGYNTATMEIDLVGDENASLLVFGGMDSKPFISIFKGDLSAYYGEMILTNRTKTIFRTSATNATIALVHTNATLTVDSSAAGTVALGTLRSQGGTIDIAQGKTLAVGALAVTGTMPKLGAGTFQAGGTATAGTDAVLAVSNGFIRATSADAFKGVGLYFAAGTGFVVDITDGAPLKTTSAVTAGGTVAVQLDGVSRTATYDEPIVIAKVPTASATAFAAKLAVKRPRGYVVSEPTAGATADAEGLVPISVTLTRVGTAIFLR